MTPKYISETTSHAKDKLFAAVATFIGWAATADSQYHDTQSRIDAQRSYFGVFRAL
ncbi:MAG: hypothetical protein V7730_11510 [Sulfitobacter sp.]